ncbi:MAG: glycosyltransferase family 4 protein [Patescibacteria group bacterium]
MKSLLFTLEYPPFRGGIANYYGNLAKFWPIKEKLNVLDNNRGELSTGNGFMSWWPAIFALKRKLARDKYDFLLVGQILPLGTAAFIVSLFRPTKYIVFLHGMDLAFALRSEWKRGLSHLILRRAHKIICANSFVQEKLMEFDSRLADKTGLINPGIEGDAPNIDEAELRNLKNSYNLDGQTILLSLGRLVKRKGVDRTIEALVHIPENIKQNLRYFIAGAGPREEYLKQLVPAHCAERITFLGELSEEEKWAWLKLCDIFIMPSRDISGDFEGFGIVYLEANLCSKPVIAGNSGGVRDAVINEETGLLVDPDKVDAIGAAIVRLADDPVLRERLGAQGRARAIRDFSWEKQAAQTWQLIKE